MIEFQKPVTVLKVSESKIVTPSDYFRTKYPAETEIFGPAFLEIHTLQSDGTLHVEPVSINEDFFASVIGGQGRASTVIFFEPERLFYYSDPVLGHYTPSSEAKLKLCLSQELLKCAQFFSNRLGEVEVRPLFEFRSREVLDAIIDRSKALLAKDQSYFAEGSGNRKDPIRLSGEQTAKMFVAEAVERQEGSVLKLGDAYDRYWHFCRQKDVPAAPKNGFKAPTAAAIRERFNLGLRNDLTIKGRSAHGWKGLAVQIDSAGTALDE